MVIPGEHAHDSGKNPVEPFDRIGYFRRTVNTLAGRLCIRDGGFMNTPGQAGQGPDGVFVLFDDTTDMGDLIPTLAS